MGKTQPIAPEKLPALVTSRKPLKAENPRDVLADIFELLEGYGPLWYSEELHKRVETALSLGAPPPRPRPSDDAAA